MSTSDELPAQEIQDGESIRVQAADWILRKRMEEHWTDEHQRELDAWLNRSTANLLAYLRLEAAWKQTDRLAALGNSFGHKEQPVSRGPFLMRMVAAIGLLAVTGTMTAHYLQPPRVRIFSTPVGARERVMLDDGTRIELNTNTVLHLANDAATRTVYLDRGEAYFQVKHDAAHPFVVVAGRHRITDLGTAFDLRRSAENFAVVLVEGRARFDQPGKSSIRPFDLVPGDKVVASAEGLTRKQEPAEELSRELSWRRGVLVFYGTTLAEAANEFNRYSNVKLVIPDPRVAELRINGTFHINDVGAFVDATKVVLGLKLEAHDREIVISQ